MGSQASRRAGSRFRSLSIESKGQSDSEPRDQAPRSIEGRPGQAADAAARNAEFFARAKHGRDVAALDTYKRIREAIEREVSGARRMLDVGNGGVFEYDPGLVDQIV